MNKTYAGIGSRKTPEDVLKVFESVALFLAKNDFALRSGGADGADSAFEIGCDKVSGKKEIFLPWKGFNDSQSELFIIPKEATELCEKTYKTWPKFNQAVKKLFARNTQQVLGVDLKNPSDFIICWTENGKFVGGTACALLFAKENNIPVFNVGSYDSISSFKQNFYAWLKQTYLKDGESFIQ